jgi:hypothetical protein
LLLSRRFSAFPDVGWKIKSKLKEEEENLLLFFSVSFFGVVVVVVVFNLIVVVISAAILVVVRLATSAAAATAAHFIARRLDPVPPGELVVGIGHGRPAGRRRRTQERARRSTSDSSHSAVRRHAFGSHHPASAASALAALCRPIKK